MERFGEFKEIDVSKKYIQLDEPPRCLKCGSFKHPSILCILRRRFIKPLEFNTRH